MRALIHVFLSIGLSLTLCSIAPAQAVVREAPPQTTLEGVTIPSRIEVMERPLVLNGIALRKKAVFKVYVAGLYLPAKSANADAILDADAPRCLVMQFLRSVSSGKLCDAWDEDLEANTPNASAGLKDEYKTLCEWMEDVGSGEQVTFTYTPGGGTTVRVKNKTKGILLGKDFADALFRSWIGPHPGPGPDFKRALLGG